MMSSIGGVGNGMSGMLAMQRERQASEVEPDKDKDDAARTAAAAPAVQAQGSSTGTSTLAPPNQLDSGIMAALVQLQAQQSATRSGASS